MTPKYVLIKRAAELTGYSEKAINQKIDSGTWLEGHQWRKAPDGHRLVNLEGFERWVEGQQAQFSRAASRSASNSSGRASA